MKRVRLNLDILIVCGELIHLFVLIQELLSIINIIIIAMLSCLIYIYIYNWNLNGLASQQ